jgi:hypothetical protein
MAFSIQHKRNDTAGTPPPAASIAVGEIAINFADKAIYTKNTAGAIIQLGGAGGAVIADAEPTTKTDGMIWVDTINGGTYIWNAAGSTWIGVTSKVVG